MFFYCNCFYREVVSLQQQIASISSELATSQQAYTTYRQRAKESLQKTAMDMNAAEKQAAELSAVNKVVQLPLFCITINVDTSCDDHTIRK